MRTPEEYVFVGHADVACSILLAQQTWECPDFLAQVKEWAQPGDTILVDIQRCLLGDVPLRRPLRDGG